MQHPEPRYRAEGDLQRTRPIDAALKWILEHPATELLLDLVEISSFSKKQKRLSKHHKVLMAIEFPNVFVVSGSLGVEVRDHAEIRKPGGLPRWIVPAPVDFRSCV